MTHPKPKTPKLKHPFILTLLILLVLAAAWVSYFLATFNLNNYRQEVEAELQAMLSLPVNIGQLHYNVHEAHIALSIDGLDIGTGSSTFQITTPKVFLTLAWQGLLTRDIRFSELTLEAPEAYIRLPETSAGHDQLDTQEETFLGIALLESLHVKAMEIRDGSLRIQRGLQKQRVHLSNIDGEISDIRLGEKAEITLNGDLIIADQAQPSSWQLRGETALGIDAQSNFLPALALDLDIKGFDLDALGSAFSGSLGEATLSGSTKVNLLVNGEIDALAFQLGLSSSGASVLPGRGYTDPISFRNLFVQGQLLSGEEGYTADNISVQIDKSRLSGKLSLLTAVQPKKIEVALYQSDFTVAQLLQWLPGKLALRDSIKEQGTIKLEHAAFSVTFASADVESQWHLRSVKGDILKLATANNGTLPLLFNSIPFEVKDGGWAISDATALWGAQELALNGAGSFSADQWTVSNLDIKGTLDAKELLRESQALELPAEISGAIPVEVHLEGNYDQLTMDLYGDLSDFVLNYADSMTIKPKPGDSLNLHGTLSPERFSLDHGGIQWSLLKGHVSGGYPLGKPEELAINALLTINDLTELSEIIPLLKKMQLHGQADLSLVLHGNSTDRRPEIDLTLRDAGLIPTKFIAELNRINGRLKITPEGLFADRLQVYMGESAFSVKAQLADFSDPALDLQVTGTAVRARDVVFSSETATLRDIEGRLHIDRDGLVFDQIGVHLDGGTDATVNGTISFHRPYPVQLDITSGFAKVSEIVGLWSGASRKKAPLKENTATSVPRAKTTVTINASVDNGDLYGMKFQKASGVISPGRDRLLIHPLDFSVGEGYCNAQVIVDFQPAGPAVLRVSGHAEDVDALEVYRELLNQENIVRGKLRGDFYLSGEIGPGYLPSSYGEFSVEVHQGVLHKFQVLSKVFSLLNVSQIFALKLPDMDLEGMPFDKLTANFHLDNGILRSEDLKIMSEAMNQGYVGHLDLVKEEIDLKLQVHPLGTVDKIVTRIPLAGWLLTGDNKAFLTAYFSVKGQLDDVSVNVMPLDTLSDQTIGLLKRTLGLPFKLVEDPQILWGGDGSKE